MEDNKKPARATAIIFSMLNPATNSYDTVGKVVLVAAKIKGQLSILAINNGKPFFMIPVTPEVQWEIQNNVYCSYVDSNNRRCLMQFPNVIEARAFSAIALSQKLDHGAKTVCLTRGTGSESKLTDSIVVNYKAYDCLMSEISEPIREEENFQILPNEDSPFRPLAGQPAGSVFAVSYAPGVVAIAEIVDPFASTASLPMTSNMPSVSSANSTPQSSKTDKSRKKNKNKSNSKAKTNPKSDDGISKQIPKQEDQKFDDLLEDIMKEMKTLFDRTESEVSGIHNADLLSSSLEPSTDTLIASLQRLQCQNMKRSAILEERNLLISTLNSREVDTSEVDKIRRQIGEYSTQLSAKKDQNKKLEKAIEQLTNEINDANNRLVQAQIDAEVAVKTMESNKSIQRLEMESKIEDLKWNLQNEKDDVESLKKELMEQQNEQRRILAAKEEDYTDELNQMKKQLEQGKAAIKEKFVKAVIGAVNQGMKANGEFPTQNVIRILEQAMMNQYNNQFNPQNDDDDEEDDYDEEEEE
ncbi:hypothetical protein TVAG_357840 [Trichomonas vaginalis G3]|uniref:Uncharacterized protein n=1 Tax=Trichomonas vaginalis (strain ATCC PRA-98 / G3) TaxID=412133 RepID=A2F3D1_TRIV3|nr:hypothetical protein TVAGG3_0161290 [Trichomonas vaginalis G3]EAY00578.1 hypothetical protein TVAG_357840 [Trichomonas vaginalis G3]KAI5547887.1 hypothetical protein TVAGG3_0161290 [Trichomonas vaginalis G3]|eukprot:XP_001313507.1 hypothetical protein [Trichomonas vaginalis G3]